MGASLPAKEANLFLKLIVKSYEYKKGLKAADAILKKIPDHGAWMRIEGLDSAMIRARLETENETYNCIGTVLAKGGCWSFLKGGFLLNYPSNSSTIFFQNTDDKYVEQISKDFPIGSAISKTILGNLPYQNWSVDLFDCQRTPLGFLQGDKFREAAESYIRPLLTKGVPSLFSDLSSLYDHPGKADIFEQLILELEHSIRTSSQYPGSTEKESPSNYLRTLFFLAQHYDRRGQYEISPFKVDEAEARGMDGSHWLVVYKPPFGIQLIDSYAQYYAKLLKPYFGSKEEALKIIYSISVDIYFGFGAVLTEETIQNLRGQEGVAMVIRDTYVNIPHKRYAGYPVNKNGEWILRP